MVQKDKEFTKKKQDKNLNIYNRRKRYSIGLVAISVSTISLIKDILLSRANIKIFRFQFDLISFMQVRRT